MFFYFNRKLRFLNFTHRYDILRVLYSDAVALVTIRQIDAGKQHNRLTLTAPSLAI